MDHIDPRLALIREGFRNRITALRKDLDAWIRKHTWPLPSCDDPADAEFRGPYVEISAALLETAIDRMIALHGGIDARAFVLKTVDDRVSLFKRGLQ